MRCLISNFGYKMVYVLNDPETNSYVALNPDYFEKDIGGLFSDELYDDAVFSTGGEFWKKQRNFLSKLFTHE